MNIRVNTTVFFTSALVILVFVGLGAFFPAATEAKTQAVQTFISSQLGWYYSIAMMAAVGFVIYLLFSRFGDIKLGKEDETPEFSNVSWFAMLFSAGIGIGLLFFGVAEPLIHYLNPPHSEPQSQEAAIQSLRIVFFHWGFHGWALYVIVGLSLAYFSYRFELPLTFRSILYPLIGDDIHGFWGNLVETLAVFATMFGIATSLGLGVMQVNAGMDFAGLMDVNQTNQLIIIAGITLMATISVVSGLDAGIRRLSELNFFLGVGLLLFIFVAGPTVFLMKAYIQGMGEYVSGFVSLGLYTDAFGSNSQWMQNWTLFYWGWWISWSPFVGMFIARISRGRTIREFILGVLGVPCIFITFWMTVFGGTGIYLQRVGGAELATANISESIPKALYLLLENLPFTNITIGIAILSGMIYFVTSSDSGSLVIDILTSGGDPDPPVWQRVFWAVTEGAVASILLVTGGLKALRAASLTTALPFSIVIIVMSYNLVQALRADYNNEPIHPDMEEEQG